MRDETVAAILTVAKGDPEVTPEQMKGLTAVLKTPIPRRATVSARQAMAILGVSRPTLRRWAATGAIPELRLSRRKLRYPLDEVERLAYSGRA